MANQSGWNFTISVGGILLIPVKLSKTVKEDTATNLHEYHITDMGRGGRSKYCKDCGVSLLKDDIIKGFEISKGKVVTFTEAELKSLPLNTTRNIELDNFVKSEEINSLVFESSYHIIPATDVSLSALQLFKEGLLVSNKVAIGKMAITNRERVCAIYVKDGGLVASTLYWAEEVKATPKTQKVTVKDAQLSLMGQIIEKFSGKFDHESYVDNYKKALREMAEAKSNGEVIDISAPETPALNLEEALKALING